MYLKGLYDAMFLRIKKTLVTSWDPIAICSEAGAQDEYDSFIPTILDLMNKGANPEVLSLYLQKIESDDFGLVPNTIRAQLVAEELIRLFSENIET